MAAYNIKLRRRDEVAEGTTAVYFEKPEGFQFKAGQFLLQAHADVVSAFLANGHAEMMKDHAVP